KYIKVGAIREKNSYQFNVHKRFHSPKSIYREFLSPNIHIFKYKEKNERFFTICKNAIEGSKSRSSSCKSYFTHGQFVVQVKVGKDYLENFSLIMKIIENKIDEWRSN
ncbi:MAG: hypothetical protein AAGF15_08250, partial [Pseudomonadota bacterium]